LCLKRPVRDAGVDMARAGAEILSRSGCVRVSDVARRAGIGIRQLERRFRYEIGISPKLYARIARFEAALRRKAAAPQTTWTDIAHVLGYHDQMHMMHDFGRLSGESPTAIDGQLDMFVQPEVVSGPTAAEVASD
jgi:AraC-like DNA-binding protein